MAFLLHCRLLLKNCLILEVKASKSIKRKTDFDLSNSSTCSLIKLNFTKKNIGSCLKLCHHFCIILSPAHQCNPSQSEHQTQCYAVTQLQIELPGRCCVIHCLSWCLLWNSHLADVKRCLKLITPFKAPP